MEKLAQYRQECAGLDAGEVVRWALNTFGSEKIILASSLSLEDQVLTDYLVKADKKARILTLDTGRLFQETYDVLQESMEKYGIRYEVLFPDSEAVEQMERELGPNLMYSSLENRKRCCGIRKIEPLKRVLSTVDAWICGIRHEHSVSRSEVEVVEWDDVFGIYKICPILEWSTEDLKTYIKQESVPYNKLQDQGFISIGCAPCTRAILPGEDNRSGRWWWEHGIKRECGLHQRKQ